MPLDMPDDILEHMRLRDVEAFARTARFHEVFILVRRSNPASIRFVGKAGYTPKPLDCKAKTAKAGVFSPELNRYLDIAGLVADPTLPGFEKAYPGKKHEAAVAIWETGFKPLLHATRNDDGSRRAWITGRYFLDRDPASPHHGCVKLTPSGLVSAGRWLHGDYDLYAIVPAEQRKENVRVQETMLGQPHARGQKFKDVQLMLNRLMGANMVLHGSQETYSEDTDDVLDVFEPDGRTVRCLRGSAAILGFYEKELGGRRLWAKHAADQAHFGDWRRLGTNPG